jgi:hypothetical protein
LAQAMALATANATTPRQITFRDNHCCIMPPLACDSHDQ